MIQFKENAWTEGQMEGQKDRQSQFHRILSATVGGPITLKKNTLLGGRISFLSKLIFKNVFLMDSYQI